MTLDYPPWMIKLIGDTHAGEECFVWKDNDLDDKKCTDPRMAFCNYTIANGKIYNLEAKAYFT